MLNNKEMVVLMNMKIAFMEAARHFDWNANELYDKNEMYLDINFSKRIQTLSEAQIDNLYRELCEGTELVYLSDKKAFQLGNKCDFQSPINEVSEYSLSTTQ